MKRKILNFKNKLSRKNSGSKNTNLRKQIFVVVSIIFLIFVALFPLLMEFRKFETHTSFQVEESFVKNRSSKQVILLVGLDKKEAHTFIDALTVAIVDFEDRKVGLINLPPDTLSNGIPLRRVLLSNDKNIGVVIKNVESVLARKINEYVVVDKVFFEEMSGYTQSIELELKEDLRDPDVIRNSPSAKWDKGTSRIGNCCVYEFLSSDSNGIGDQLDRQLKLYMNYTKSIPPIKVIFGYKDISEKISKYLDTSLDKYELVKLYFLFNGLTESDFRLLYPKEEYLVPQGKLGVYDVYYLNTERFDNELGSMLEDDEVVLEQAVLEVLNASGQGGLATERSRWISNIGVNVIHIANAPYTEEKTKIYVQNKAIYQKTIESLKTILGDEVEVVESEYPYRHIGELVVTLGKDQIN